MIKTADARAGSRVSDIPGCSQSRPGDRPLLRPVRPLVVVTASADFTARGSENPQDSADDHEHQPHGPQDGDTRQDSDEEQYESDDDHEVTLPLFDSDQDMRFLYPAKRTTNRPARSSERLLSFITGIGGVDGAALGGLVTRDAAAV